MNGINRVNSLSASCLLVDVRGNYADNLVIIEHNSSSRLRPTFPEPRGGGLHADMYSIYSFTPDAAMTTGANSFLKRDSPPHSLPRPAVA